jgi:hypothetical protein
MSVSQGAINSSGLKRVPFVAVNDASRTRACPPQPQPKTQTLPKSTKKSQNAYQTPKHPFTAPPVPSPVHIGADSEDGQSLNTTQQKCKRFNDEPDASMNDKEGKKRPKVSLNGFARVATTG